MDGGKKKGVRGWEREEARDREVEEKAKKFSTSSISAALTQGYEYYHLKINGAEGYHHTSDF